MKLQAHKRHHGDDRDSSRQLSRKRDGVGVDVVRTVVDERRRCNRGRQDGNGRVDAEVDAIRSLESRRGLGLSKPTMRQG